MPGMELADPTVAVWETMDHDVSAWITSDLPGEPAIRIIGIGHPERAVVMAVDVPPDDAVAPFRSPIVTLAAFRPARLTAQGDAIRSHQALALVQPQFPQSLLDDDAIGLLTACRSEGCHGQGEEEHCCQDPHRH